MMLRYSHDEIEKVIPNRYPLMFLDALEVDEDHATGYIDLKNDTWFFECHYPDEPVMPMSLLMESMTQTFSAVFLSQTDKPEIPVISSVSGPEGKEIRMRERAVPGDHIRLEAKLRSFRRGIAKGKCAAYKNEDEAPIMEIEIVEALPSQMVRMR